MITTRLPVIAAPMAAVSTPELVRAVDQEGGLGFLAGGLKTAQQLAEHLATVADLDHFGVNLFVPESQPRVDLEPRRRALTPIAARFGVEPGRPDWGWDEDFAAKIDLLEAQPVAVVSFSFGLPPQDAMQRLRAVDTEVWSTVTNQAEAIAAWTRGVDALVVQGPEAGGHRGTQRQGVPPDTTPLPQLLAAISQLVPLPLVAAGGISTPDQARELLSSGAAAVQLGTLLLRSDESGALQTHKDALAWPRETVVTRCFSGRWARSLRNEFTDQHREDGLDVYPQVSHLTAPIRAAAARAGDAEHLQLWAGTGHLAAQPGPAGEILREFAAGL